MVDSHADFIFVMMIDWISQLFSWFRYDWGSISFLLSSLYNWSWEKQVIYSNISQMLNLDILMLVNDRMND